ncbi:MAG: hypothetical protein ACOY35_08370 [Bacillota bacterium]
MKITLYNLFLQGWPETAALVFTAFSIIGYKLPIRSLAIHSFILTSVVWLIRIFSITGLHTLVSMLWLAILIKNVARVSFAKSVNISFCVFFLLLCIETSVHIVIKKVFGQISLDQGFIWVLLGWPQIFIMIAIGLIIQNTRFWIIDKFKNKGVLND